MSIYGPHELPEMEQHPEEWRRFMQRLIMLQPKSYLEIGVWQGGTLLRIAEAFPECRVVGIDPRPMLSPIFDTMQPGTVYFGASQDFDLMRRIVGENGGPFDVVFIDGDHTYDNAKSDWSWSLQNTSHLIALHDVACADERGGVMQVKRIWDEIVATGEHDTEELYDDPKPQNGIGLVWL